MAEMERSADAANRKTWSIKTVSRPLPPTRAQGDRTCGKSSINILTPQFFIDQR
jgi:hypothetical protein